MPPFPHHGYFKPFPDLATLNATSACKVTRTGTGQTKLRASDLPDKALAMPDIQNTKPEVMTA